MPVKSVVKIHKLDWKLEIWRYTNNIILFENIAVYLSDHDGMSKFTKRFNHNKS